MARNERAPYRIGYGVILLVVVVSFLYASYSSYVKYQESVEEVHEEVERCLARYTERSCSSSSLQPPSEECNKLYDCIRNRAARGLWLIVLEVLSKLTTLCRAYNDQHLGAPAGNSFSRHPFNFDQAGRIAINLEG